MELILVSFKRLADESVKLIGSSMPHNLRHFAQALHALVSLRARSSAVSKPKTKFGEALNVEVFIARSVLVGSARSR
jgi:hypothetical protein